MPQIRHIANFRFPNFHPRANGGANPENTCEVLIASNEDMTQLDVLMVQRRDEWKRGTSAINQAEVIATKLVNEIFPDLYHENPKLRSAKLYWYVQVVTEDAVPSRISAMEINFSWPPNWQRTWLWEKFVGRTEIVLESFSFKGSVSPDTLLVRLDD